MNWKLARESVLSEDEDLNGPIWHHTKKGIRTRDKLFVAFLPSNAGSDMNTPTVLWHQSNLSAAPRDGALAAAGDTFLCLFVDLPHAMQT